MHLPLVFKIGTHNNIRSRYAIVSSSTFQSYTFAGEKRESFIGIEFYKFKFGACHLFRDPNRSPEDDLKVLFSPVEVTYFVCSVKGPTVTDDLPFANAIKMII